MFTHGIVAPKTAPILTGCNRTLTSQIYIDIIFQGVDATVMRSRKDDTILERMPSNSLY